tara:strand:+ start:559 stop:2805 length:2247 start_codon:yes stop_codon:yes gene_type:complete
MASRTQIRLEQLTGSMAAPANLGSKVALASLPAGHLGDVLDEMGQAIARIHGEKDFTNKDAGVFTHAQSIFNGQIRATGAAFLSGSAQVEGASLLKSTLEVTGNADLNAQLDVAGNVNLQAELAAAGAITFSAASGASAASDPDVGISGHVAIAKDMQAANIKSTATIHSDGEATLASAIVEDLTSGRVVLAGTGGAIEDHASLTFNGSLLSAPEAAFGTEMVAASAKVQDLTAGRVVLAGTNGEIEDSGNLAFNGSKLTVTGTQQVTSHMDIDGELDAALAVNFQAGLTVAANADFNGELDVAGASSFAATGVLTDIRGTLSVDEAAIFDANVTISGNLTVAGSTTTVNTEEVTIADHNIVLDSNNTTGAVINGAGLTFEGGTGDDLTFQWNSGDSEMQLKLGSAYADLEIKDLDAVGATLSGDLAAAAGSFSGAVSAASAAISGAATAGSADIAGTLEAAVIKIDGDSAQRLYIVDADGSMKDEAKLVFDQTKLAVTGDEEVSGYLRAGKLEIDSNADYIDVNNAIQLNSSHGAFSFMAGGTQFGKIAQVSGNMRQISEGDIEFAYEESGVITKVASIDGSALSLLIDGTKKLEFNDAAEAMWSSGAELMLKSNSVSYAFPQADAAAADYVLVSDGAGQLSWKSSSAASSAAAKKINVKLAAAISSTNSDGEYEYDYSGFSSAEKSAILAATNSIIDVYVNGQLLVGYKNGTPIGANADYDWNTGGEKILFAFALEVDDVITVVVR